MKKKILFVSLALILVLAACNRKAFVKKLVGSYTLNGYIFSGQDKFKYYDTTYRNLELTLGDDQVYSQSWTTFTFRRDSSILADTLFDTAHTVISISFDTLRWVDTDKQNFVQIGKWELINSEEDLQLRNDSDQNNPNIFRILELTKSNMNLLKGNEEFHWKKK